MHEARFQKRWFQFPRPGRALLSPGARLPAGQGIGGRALRHHRGAGPRVREAGRPAAPPSGKRGLATARSSGEAGFSLLELSIVLLIFSILIAASLTLFLQAQKSFAAHQSSSGAFHSGLTALTQMSREIKMAGFPSVRSFSAGAVLNSPGIVAQGYLAASDYNLAFEFDLNGDGQVERVEYLLPQGSETILRRITVKNPDGTLAVANAPFQPFLDNIQNRVMSQPLFGWELDPLSAQPFPGNIRTVYVTVVLKGNSVVAPSAAHLTFRATCRRMNP